MSSKAYKKKFFNKKIIHDRDKDGSSGIALGSEDIKSGMIRNMKYKKKSGNKLTSDRMSIIS